jgi:hypothetical protein
MKVRAIKNFRMKAVPNVEIQAGSELEVAPDVGIQWISKGYAIPFTERTEKAVLPEPEKRNNDGRRKKGNKPVA